MKVQLLTPPARTRPKRARLARVPGRLRVRDETTRKLVDIVCDDGVLKALPVKDL